jgi:hypothetical protein
MRIVVALAADERKALCEMARRDLRDPRDQLRYVLREAARIRGLLPTESQPNEVNLAKCST